MATKAKTKTVAKKKPVVKTEEKVAKTEVTETNSSKKLMIGGVIVIVLLLAITLIAVLLAGKLSKSSDDEGIKIPSNFETYEGEGFVLGYPDGYKVESNFGLNIISRQDSDIL